MDNQEEDNVKEDLLFLDLLFFFVDLLLVAQQEENKVFKTDNDNEEDSQEIWYSPPVCPVGNSQMHLQKRERLPFGYVDTWCCTECDYTKEVEW